MSKDFDDYKDDYDKNPGNYDYDDEMSRKAVGKLLNSMDDDEPVTASKPVVRAIRINSEKIKKEKISTSFYDEDRGKKNNADDDLIVTGFKDEEIPDDTIIQQEAEHVDDDLGDTVRTRRPNILKDESSGDRDERERYRKQFLGGYTDHRRKGLDLTSPAPVNETRKRTSAQNTDEPVKRIPAERPQRDSKESELPRRRPRGEDISDTKPPARERGRRSKDTDDELSVIPKRSERKERPAYAAPTSAQPLSYDAPIFKIIAGVLLAMLVVMVILVFNVISANGTISDLEEQIAGFEMDVDELSSLRIANEALTQQVQQRTDERNEAQFRVDELERQLETADVSNAPVSYLPGDSSQPTTATRSYTVASGDSLSAIANRFNLGQNGVNAIMAANGLTSATIHVGQELIIPN